MKKLKHVIDEEVEIPQLWKYWDEKWYPTTQSGILLKYSYPIHYISVARLKLLNDFGDYIATQTWIAHLNKKKIGELAVLWMVSYEIDISEAKKWMNFEKKIAYPHKITLTPVKIVATM